MYLAEQYTTPLFIGHGGEDYRVDVEHYHRLVMMLEYFDKDFEKVLYPKSGHGFADSETAADFHERLLRFLSKHLKLGS